MTGHEGRGGARIGDMGEEDSREGEGYGGGIQCMGMMNFGDRGGIRRRLRREGEDQKLHVEETPIDLFSSLPPFSP